MNQNPPWYRELTRYHWFVLIVAALGWLFDTMDQQLFNLARVPAMKELLAPSPGVAADPADVSFYGGLATSIFLIGWAFGGLTFGVLGDRWGRAKVMLITILMYSAFTGLSALSVGFWDFAFYRFLTGLGVGGEFAVGVSLVAEVMPDRARPFALGLLQALSAVGNITAAVTSMVLGQMEQDGTIGSAWRIMFIIGTLPALLAVFIRRRLKEPERWQAAAVDGKVQEQLGSYSELFRTPRWRKNAIVGLLLASSGVIGLWGIGFFSFDLLRSIQRKTFEAQARQEGATVLDQSFLQLAFSSPDQLEKVAFVTPAQLLGPAEYPKDASLLYETALALHKQEKPVTTESVLNVLDKSTDKRPAQTAAERARRSNYLTSNVAHDQPIDNMANTIVKRSKDIDGLLTFWAGIVSVMQNIGGFFGIYAFSRITHILGRRKTLAISFVAALISTAYTFWHVQTFTDIFWMVPIMGFCQLSLFGGYAIYFPELFPTRLRSTGTSFCYNVGRFVAAVGPYLFGILTSTVFVDKLEPLRYAGVTMSAIFLLGLIVLPFAPETKGQPLPD